MTHRELNAVAPELSEFLVLNDFFLSYEDRSPRARRERKKRRDLFVADQRRLALADQQDPLHWFVQGKT